MRSIRENRLFLGNPGTGKSTLINCLLHGNHFRSGLSWGGGLTQDYQRFEANGIAYMDTPGLADEIIQEEAAREVSKALKEGGNYKLFFMVRLQNGRLVSEDLVTLERVLDSIDAGDLNYKYTVVMNCIGQRQYKALLEHGGEFKTIKALVNRRYRTDSFCFVPRIEELEEAKDGVVQLPQDVVRFLDEGAPVVSIEEHQVKPIQISGFREQTTMLASEIEKLRSSQAAMMEEIKEQERQHKEALKQLRSKNAAEIQRLGMRYTIPETGSLSPIGGHDYAPVPTMPPAVGRHVEDRLSSMWAALLHRRKLVVALVLILLVVVGIVIGVAVGTSEDSPETPPPPPKNTSDPGSGSGFPPGLIRDAVESGKDWAYVALYDDTSFFGKNYTFKFFSSQFCFNIDCMSSRASSMRWANIVTTGSVRGDGNAYIAVYASPNCDSTGAYAFAPVTLGSVSDLSVNLKGINNEISSFMVWKTSEFATGSEDLCANA